MAVLRHNQVVYQQTFPLDNLAAIHPVNLHANPRVNLQACLLLDPQRQQLVLLHFLLLRVPL